MRKHRILWALLAMVALALPAKAQDEIQFAAAYPSQTEGLTPKAAETLFSKVSQILNRNSAAAGGDFSVFVVEPALAVGGANTTSGLVQNVSSLSGELILTAKNTADNSEYYSVTVPLKTVTKQVSNDPSEALAAAIKVTDPVYVRFIRTARQNIAKAFEENCDAVIARAKTLFVAGDQEAAAQMLKGVPPTASCYDEALELLAGITVVRKQQEGVESVPARVDTVYQVQVVPGDTVVVQQVVVPPTPAPAPAPAPTPAPAPQPQTVVQPEIYVSNSNWNVELASCTFAPVNRRVVLKLKITNSKGTDNTVYSGIEHAITESGETLTNFGVDGDWYNLYPMGVGVVKTYYLNGLPSNPGKIVFMDMKLGSAKVEIRNLNVAQ